MQKNSQNNKHCWFFLINSSSWTAVKATSSQDQEAELDQLEILADPPISYAPRDKVLVRYYAQAPGCIAHLYIFVRVESVFGSGDNVVCTL